jgi:hypothetical protein
VGCVACRENNDADGLLQRIGRHVFTPVFLRVDHLQLPANHRAHSHRRTQTVAHEVRGIDIVGFDSMWEDQLEIRRAEPEHGLSVSGVCSCWIIDERISKMAVEQRLARFPHQVHDF